MPLLSPSDHVAVGFTVALAVILIMISRTDLREMRIPNVWNGALLGLGLLACVVVGHQTVGWALTSSIVGLMILEAIRWIYRGVRNADGLGFGDVKFVAAAASWIGLEALPHMILAASVAALCWVSLKSMWGRTFDRATRVPFGPFLSMGLFAVWMMMFLR